MTNIADNVVALETAVAGLPDAFKAALAGLVLPTPTVDLTEVVKLVADLSAKVDGVSAKVDKVLGDVEPTVAS